MSDLRDVDDRLIEIEAVLEQLRQVKEDTFQLMASLQPTTADPESLSPRETGEGQSWMPPAADESGVVSADD